MKQIVLRRIELTNFKGQAHRVEEFNDGENFIIGANATGKTSVFDAFTWLLFGKDSKGQADDKAKIKMLDKNGQPIWGLDNSVEATFIVDGEELTLKRTYKEKWRKPQGQAEKVYDGQTTSFSWNGNEKISANEYKKRVSELIDEELFRLITNPHHFANLDPKKRREIVLGMAGEVDENEIIAKEPKLIGFDASNVEETRAIAQSTRLRTIKERDNYPARIDEVNQNISVKQAEIDNANIIALEDINVRKQALNQELKALDDELLNVQASVDKALQLNQQRLVKLNAVEDYKNKKQREENAKISKHNEEISKASDEIKQLKSGIANLTKTKEETEVIFNNLKQRIEDFKKELKVLNAEPIPTFEDAICPTCGRPFENQEAHKEEMKNRWIENQKDKIREVRNKGNMTYTNAKSLQRDITQIQEEIDKDTAKLKELEPIANKVMLAGIDYDFENDAEYQKLVAEVPAELKADETINQIRENNRVKRDEINQQLDALKIEEDKHTRIKMLQADINQSKNRIISLENEEKQTSQVIANQEKIIYLCDLYTKTKIDLLNTKISNKFNLVKFKMFNYTQEGNPVPCCEITIDGVDYTALNTAKTINAGLDIINALIDYYQVKAPIFIDNRESVTEINAPATQIINLKVEGE